MTPSRPERRYGISIRGLRRSLGVDRRKLSLLVRKTLAAERAPDGTLSVAFVGPRTMRRINREYRDIDRPTDVLSFSYVGEPHAGGVLGEIYISPSIAAANAHETGDVVAEEIARLTIHGILHILGYDHDSPRSRRRMLRRQERYLDRHYLAAQPC